MYANVKTWDNLCQINAEFLKGHHSDTFYHAGQIDYETIENPNFLYDLIKLNNIGIFTHSSQPGLNTPYEKKKSYLDFCCEQELAYQLLPRLLDESNNGDIYISFHSAHPFRQMYIDTFPIERYNLTKYIKNNQWYYYTFWNKSSMINNNNIVIPNICEMTSYATENNQILYELLLNSVNITIASKDFDEDFSAPGKLLDIIDIFTDSLNSVD
jgi:hypothetical protein